MSRNKDQYLNDAWQQVLEYLLSSNSVAPELIDTFFRDCVIAELNEDKTIITAPNIVSKQIVSNETEAIKTAFQDTLDMGSDLIVEILLKSEYVGQQISDYIETNNNSIDDYFQSLPIQADRTFDNFVVGDCNRESQAAALACAYNPGKYFNPLFIYGNSGLGKTHLLMAIGNYVKKAYPDKKVYYIELN